MLELEYRKVSDSDIRVDCDLSKFFALLGQEASWRVVNSTTKATDLAQMIKGSGQSQIGSELSDQITNAP